MDRAFLRAVMGRTAHIPISNLVLIQLKVGDVRVKKGFVLFRNLLSRYQSTRITTTIAIALVVTLNRIFGNNKQICYFDVVALNPTLLYS